MIIDFHTHIFPPEIVSRHLNCSGKDACFDLLYSDPKARMISAEELVRNMDDQGIDVSVALNIGWSSHELCQLTNDYIIDAVNRFPGRLIGFCAVQPLAGQKAIDEIKRCARYGIKGIGELRCDTQGFDLTDREAMSPLVEAAMRHNLIILTHASEPVGHTYTGKGEISPGILYRFIQNFPAQLLVCAHWGGGLPFYALMPEMAAAMKNVYFDTAASPFLYRDEVFLHVADILGADKILFGSDHPLIRQDRIVKAVMSLPMPEASKKAILGDNASRLLSLN
ncbi:MAG: amidohydrolase [Dehalococcoidia bacterium]|nr:amidohydrolase [Dehalococcoidia bacterium]